MRLSEIFVTKQNPDGTKRLAQFADIAFPLKSDAKRCLEPVLEITFHGKLTRDQIDTVRDMWIGNVVIRRIAAAIGIEIIDDKDSRHVARILHDCGCRHR